MYENGYDIVIVQFSVYFILRNITGNNPELTQGGGCTSSSAQPIPSTLAFGFEALYKDNSFFVSKEGSFVLPSIFDRLSPSLASTPTTFSYCCRSIGYHFNESLNSLSVVAELGERW